MSAISLQLQHCPEAQRVVAAWYLQGDDAAFWLEELGRWAGAQASLRLYGLPRSRQDPRPAGLLIIPPAGLRPPAGWRALALGVVEDRLFLPVDAVLYPPVGAAEIRALFRAEISLFHPGLGLIEFAASDCRGVWDLIESPVLIPAIWNAARSDTALNSRLLGVSLLALPEGEELFGDAEKEIGKEPPTKLPRRSKEPSAGPIGQIGRTVAGLGIGALGKMLSWMPSASGSPGKPPARGWINDAMDWAAAKLAGISREMEELRHRELHRLMDMLNSDPERGLRHALPLAGDPGRGRAAPGGHLGPRDMRFRVGGANAGGPSDHWDVPWELRQKLTARYRELALREKQLGRFQRAAYIYAELLGDWNSAAAVLKEGRHFAEAGVVFRDRLHQPQAAAECFACGGLFQDAIAIYEKEKMFLELGDLHRKLGDEAAASVAFWKVVEQRTAAGDLLGAAALLELRLQLPDKALTLLRNAWPGAPQAVQCLTAQFDLLGRLGRHDQARQRVTELRDESTPVHQVMPLAEALAVVRTSYPDHSFRPFTADVIRQKVSGRLSAGDAHEARVGTRILSALAPEDRLLARDASRFLAARLEVLNRRVPPPLPPAPRKAGSNRVAAPQPLSDFKIPNCAGIVAVKRCGQHYVAAIRLSPREVSSVLPVTAILRGDWAGNVQAAAWSSDATLCRNVSLVSHAQSLQAEQVLVLTAPQLICRQDVLPPSDRFPLPLAFGAPSWLPKETAGVAIGGPHWWILRRAGEEWIIDLRTATGQITGSFPLGQILAEITEPVSRVSMLAMRSQLWISFDRHLFLIENAGRASRHWILETSILGLEPSAPLLVNAVVARCERGAAICWCDYLRDDVEMLATNLEMPFAACLGNGTIALLSSVAGVKGFDGQVIDVDRRGIQSQAEFSWRGEIPSGLVAMARPDGFAVFARSGEVRLFSVPTVG